MARIRAGPAALRRVAGCGNYLRQPSISALQTRGVATNAATNAATQEPNVDFPAGIPPVAVPSRSSGDARRKAIKNAKPFSDFLTDTFNRQHDYLRISITERCNLRCLYCMPEEGIPLSPSANMLTTPEIFYLSSLFVSQGVTKIRLTGGEPTVRRDIVPLMQQIGSLRPKGLRELALTTNGISLHRKLDAMVEAGLTGVNLSLDTLDPFQFQIMTRRKGFDAVMKSIDRILEMNKLGANVKLKVNCVVMRGLNEREILPFVEMGREKDIEVRFIEYMPFGGNKWSENKMISFQEMLDIIRTKYPGLRPVPGHKNDTSKTYEVPGFVGKVGFITSMTNDFCGTCNRLRITSDGNLKVCLHGNAEVSLRDVLRQGNNGEPIDQEAFERIRQIEMDRHEGRLSDETVLGWGQRERELLDVVGAAVKRKAEKHADLDDLANMENRPMILIDDKPLASRNSQQPVLRRRPFDNPHTSLARHRIPSSPLPCLNIVSQPPSTTVRAFSTSPVSAAEKLSQLEPLQKAEEIPEAGKATKNVTGMDPHSLRDFLAEVKSPQGSDRTIQILETNIINLQDRIARVVHQIDGPVTTVKEAKEKERLEAQRFEYEELLEETVEKYTSRSAALRRQAELRKQKEEILEKKRALVKQLEEQEEAERRARIVVRAREEGKGRDGISLGDILDDALKKIRKEPTHPPKIEEQRDRKVLPSDWVVRSIGGSGPYSVLGRNELDRSYEENALADPIMDKGRVPTVPGEGHAFDLLSSSPSSSPSKRPSLVVPPSGILPIDEDLIVTFDAPIPQLQQQVLALRDRLKKSYPRLDVLPYEVWTSENKRTLQTWLKILIERWQARFENVNLTGQMVKGIVDEKLKAVLDQMVIDHNLDNDAAERMAMRWHDVFSERHSLTSDAEGKLDWDEMEAEGLGFLADDTKHEPLQQQQPDVEAVAQAQHGMTEAVRGESSGSTTSRLVGRRMYSTSSRYATFPSSEAESKPSSIDKMDGKDKLHQLQPQTSQPPPSSEAQLASSQPHLPHLTASGSAHMVSVSNKQHTTRTAIAVGTVYFTNSTPLELIRSNSLKKGDVLGTSRIAGIMAAKKCPEIIPLCHPIALTHVGVELRAFESSSARSSLDSLPSIPISPYSIDPGYGGIQIEAKVQCTGPTGVEMEALTAVMGAALSVVDMCKAVDKFQRVQDVRVVLKEGGKSGVWREEGWESWQD
ncbi:Molybdenum cofactor biosynthesis protein 1 [Alternaria gaisen]|uniref:Molybdenum cofactor biosynthesis protein 1 n=1 Tax=Alternaria gaisen TaxID=167740 RepID=A0ACB6G3J1_9PLEO|nr:Molybdenum cofactor biosynthesis protein 1 [Alternaria gaisen]